MAMIFSYIFFLSFFALAALIAHGMMRPKTSAPAEDSSSGDIRERGILARYTEFYSRKTAESIQDVSARVSATAYQNILRFLRRGATAIREIRAHFEGRTVAVQSSSAPSFFLKTIKEHREQNGKDGSSRAGI